MIHLGSFVLQFPIHSIKVEPPETNDSSKSRSMATVQRTKQGGIEVAAAAGSSSSLIRHPGSGSSAKASTSAGKSSTGNVHSRSYSPTNSVVSSVESITRRVEERNSAKGIPPRRTISIPALPIIKGSRRISRFNSNESIGSSGPSHSFTVFPKLPGSNGNANTGQVFEPQNARRDSRESGGDGGHGSRQQPQKNKADVDDRGEKRRRVSEPGTSTGTGTTSNTNTNHRPVEGRQPATNKGPAVVPPSQPQARTSSGTPVVASHRDRDREREKHRNRSQERNNDRGERNRNQENRHQHNNHAHNRHSHSNRPPTLNKNHQQGHHNRGGRGDGSYSPRKDYDYDNHNDYQSRRPGPGSVSVNLQCYRVAAKLKQEQIQIKEEVIDVRQQFAIRNEEYDEAIYSINRRQDEQGTHIINLHRENDQTKARLVEMERQIRQGQRPQPAHNAGQATEGFKCPDCHHTFQSKSYLLRKHKGTAACVKNQIADGNRGGAAGNKTPAWGKAPARAQPTAEAAYGRFAERGSSSSGRPHWNRQEGETSPPFNVTSRLRPPRLQKNTTTRRR